MGSYTPSDDSADVGLKLKMPSSREFLGGDLLAQSLEALGCRVAFGIHGGHLDAFLIGCADANIDLVDTRHETTAVQAAEAYAKVADKVGVCFVTANSGFSNGLPGLATAFADRSPVFCITSSQPLRDAETNSLQGFHDQVVVAKPVTKFAHRVTNVEEIPRLVAYAWRTAIAGAPGPVLLDLPIDILFSPIPFFDRIAWGAINRPLPYGPAADENAIKEVVELWSHAKRPVIITGTGARGNTFAQDFLKLVEATNTPVFYSTKYGSVIPRGHKLRGGPAMCLAILDAINQQPPDLLILLGARTGFPLGGRGGAIIPNSGCKLIHVDVDGSEIGKSHAIDCGVVATSQNFVKQVLAANPKSSASAEWVELASSLKDFRTEHDDQPEEMSPGRLHPYHAVKTFYESIPEDSIVIIDGGEAGGWALSNLERARASLAIVSTGYLGFLGNGWGYALGAAVADPSKLIVLSHGDGSAGFHLAELDTFARFKLKILTVIVNNYVWGMSQAGQDLIYGDKTPIRQASKLSPTTEYETVAAGLQCSSAKVDKIADIPDVVNRLVNSGKPGLLNLIVDDKPVHNITKAMLNVNAGKDWIVVPYYDNVPRPYYKIG